MKTCPECAYQFTPPAFQLWNGRCPECDQAMTFQARREDRSNAEREPVTDQEFAEYLKYADDLAVMRMRDDEASQVLAIFMVGGVLWAFGIGFRVIEFEYGLFYAICMCLTFAMIFSWKLRSLCPRCRLKFGKPLKWSASPFGFRIRLGSTSETCCSCGLRALSQYDISRFLADRKAVAPETSLSE